MMKPRVFAGIALLILVSAVACNRTQTSREEGAAGPVKVAAERAGETLADDWLTAKIQAQFFADADIKSRYINVTTRDGVVKLKGFVDSDDAHRQVLEITRSTDGVRQVDDRQLLIGRPATPSFEVASTPSGPATVATTGVAPAATPAPRDDAAVVSLIQARYFLDPAIKTRNIGVEIADRVATLRGQVASENERAQALLLARSTPGVLRVEDYLTVDAALPH